MAKNGITKGLSDILLQGLGEKTDGGGSSKSAKAQQLTSGNTALASLQDSKIASQTAKAAAKDAKKKGDAAGSSGTDLIGRNGSGVANIVIGGGAGDEVLTGSDLIDTLFGAGGNDIIIGFDNPTEGSPASLGDSLYGGDGNDLIFGGSGRDFAFGGLGDDSIEGNQGDDYIEGLSGADLITDGGTGVTFSSANEVLISKGPLPGEGTTESSNEHTDEAVHGAVLPTGGYVLVWGQGIGSDQAPTQAMKFARFDALGNMIGNPVRFDTQHPGLGPFEFKGEGKVVALQGANAGRFAIVIESEFFHSDGDNKSHTYLYVFNADGTYVKSVQLSDNLNQTQLKPTVSATSDGGILVAWQDNWKDGGGTPPSTIDAGIYLRKYSLAGTTLTPLGLQDIQVNQTTSGNQTSPEMHQLSNGNILVAWNSTSLGGNEDVYFRIFNQSGAALTNEVLANTTTANNQAISNKNLTNLTNGQFVLVYTSDDTPPVDNLASNENDTDPALIPRPEGQNGKILFKIFNADGTTAVAEKTVILANSGDANPANDVTLGDFQDATVTYLPDGGFVIVFSRDINAAAGANNTNYDIFGVRFTANGTQVGDAFQINTVNDTSGGAEANAAAVYLEDQRRPHLMTLPNGTVVITWDSGKDPNVVSTRDEEIVQRIVRFGSSGGNDTMIGGSGADMVRGESGNDILYAGGTVAGASNGDVIDILMGGSGRDTINPDSGADSIFGGIGGGGGNTDALAGDFVRYADSTLAVNVNLDDDLTETGGNAQGDFITGVEHVIGTAQNDSLTGIGTLRTGQDAFALNNSLVGAGGADRLFGLDGNDSLFGDFLPANEAGITAGGDDSLYGGSGTDQLFGGTGNDILAGGAGGDVLNGGNGNDTADYSASPGAVTADLLSTGAGADAAGDTYVSVENLIGSNNAIGDILAGTDGNNTIVGLDGGDNISGRGGDDSLYGGSGGDAIAGEAGNDTIYGGAGNDNNVFGGANNDTIRGDEGDDQLNGGNGADSLAGGTGNAILIDGLDTSGDRYEGEGAGFDGTDGGQDTVSYGNATNGVVANLTTGQGTGNDASNDIYSGIEHLVGSTGNDTLIGSNVSNTLWGGGGDDTLAGLAGADVLNGGGNTSGTGGGDWANYSASAGAVQVSLGDAVTEVGGDAQGDSLVGIENVYGSNLNGAGDLIVGDGAVNSLVGLAGNDTLSGLVGNDWLYGGDDDDVLVGGAGADVMDGGANGASKVNGDYADYRASTTSGVDVDLTRALQTGGDAANDSLTNIEHLIGSSNQGDTLAGDANVNTLVGLGGNDTLFGRDGDDRLFGDSLDGSGVSGIDTLFGGSGTDSLFGQDGNDTLEGGAGVDLIFGGAGTQDWGSWANSASGVDVRLTAATQSGGDAQGDELTGIENLIGSSFADTLVGSANDNSIRGSDGNDTIVGGSGGGIDAVFGEVGDDYLLDVGGTGGDQYSGGKGADVISYEFENLGVVVNLATGSGRDAVGVTAGAATGDSYVGIENIIGSNANDTLIGNVDVNTIIGAAGDDTVQGGDAGDRLDGGAGGNDWVDYRDSNVSGVEVTLGLPGAQVSGGFANGDIIVNVENLRGSNLDDTLTSNLSDTGSGNNIIDGAQGDDSLIANSGIETFFGGVGSDWLDYRASQEATGMIINLTTGIGQGDLAEDDRYGTENGTGTGIENVRLGGGDDTLFGVIGNGLGQGGFNTFLGFTGNDVIFGGSSRDFLRGDDGNDTLNGGSGADSIIGGTGVNDFADYSGTNTQGVTIDLITGKGSGGDASGNLSGADGFDETLFSIEHLIGSGAADSLGGNDGVNWLFGATGNDMLMGRGSAGDTLTHDTLFGGDGSDILGGNASGLRDTGVDSLFGGTGADSLFYDQNDGLISGGIGIDSLFTSNGADVIQLWTDRFQKGGVDIEQYYLGGGNDSFINVNVASSSDLVNVGAGLSIFGGDGNDQISMRGNAIAISGMDDFVDAGSGNDIVWGGFGRDLIVGGVGDDQLYGGKGDDVMAGGGGFDVYYVGRDEGFDELQDKAEDVNGLVLFWGWDSAQFGPNGNQFDGLDPTEVNITYSGNDIYINMENGGTVHFIREQQGDGTWECAIDVLNLWDYGQGDAGNSTIAPSTFQRDVWSVNFDSATGRYQESSPGVIAWTLAVNG